MLLVVLRKKELELVAQLSSKTSSHDYFIYKLSSYKKPMKYDENLK